jgi:CubicO group peptidase (beta-lactamase class C family)
VKQAFFNNKKYDGPVSRFPSECGRHDHNSIKIHLATRTSKAKKNTANTLFNLASVSKTLTSTAVLQLLEKEKVRLDDPFVKYFPSFQYPAITVRHLLSHTSGLPDKDVLFNDSLIKMQPEKVWQNNDIIPALTSYGKLAFAPGDKWSYSNVNYNLLALLIEKVSGLSYADYLKRQIFIPAKMDHSYLETSLIILRDNPDRIISYAFPAPYATDLVPVNDLPGNKKWAYTLNRLIGQGGRPIIQASIKQADPALLPFGHQQSGNNRNYSQCSVKGDT